jgi:general secretion pathway protein C
MMPDEDDESEIPGIEDLRRQIKSRPHTSNGEQDGILVYGIRPKSMFRKIGLRNGDIVQQIDDTAVESTEDLLSAIQDAQEDAPINISILRGGQVRQVVYDVSGNDEN